MEITSSHTVRFVFWILRDDAIKACSVLWGKVVMDATSEDLSTLTDDERDELSRINPDEFVNYHKLNYYYMYFREPKDFHYHVAVAGVEALKASLNARRQTRLDMEAAVLADKNERVEWTKKQLEEFIVKPLEEQLSQGSDWGRPHDTKLPDGKTVKLNRYYYASGASYLLRDENKEQKSIVKEKYPDIFKRAVARQAELDALVMAKNVEQYALEQAEVLAKKEAAVREELNKRNTIRAFVADFGTPSEKERFEADVLPDAEVEAIISREVLNKPLRNVTFYDDPEMNMGRIEHEDDCDKNTSAYYEEDEWEPEQPKFTEEEWNKYKQIKAVFVEEFLNKLALDKEKFHMTVFVREGKCTNCDKKIESKYVLITADVGGIEVSRKLNITPHLHP